MNDNQSCRRPSIGAQLPLRALTTFTTRWQAIARVVEKSQINTFQRRAFRGSTQGNSQGRVFSCVIVDKERTSMNVKFWNEMVDKFYDEIEVGKVYSFSRGQIQVSNRKFSRISHDYEMVFQRDGEIHPVDDSEATQNVIPQSRKVNYQSLRSINMSTKSLPFVTDILGVVHSWMPVREVTVKDGPARPVRRIVVVDGTRFALDVSLWGDLANVDEAVLDRHPTVSLRNISVREFRGRAASTTAGSVMDFDLDTEEAKELAEWYQQNAIATEFTPLSQNDGTGQANADRVVEATLNEVENALDNPDPNQLYKVVAYVQRVLYRSRDNAINLVYDACSKCNRKVSEAGHCGSCGPAPSVVPRVGCTLVLGDHTAREVLVRAFHGQAQNLFGISVQRMERLIKEHNAQPDAPMHPDLMEALEFTPRFKRHAFILRPGQNIYNGEARHRLTVVATNSISHRSVGAAAMQLIMKMVPNAFELVAVGKRGLDSQEQLQSAAPEVFGESKITPADDSGAGGHSSPLTDKPEAKRQKMTEIEASVDKHGKSEKSDANTVVIALDTQTAVADAIYLATTTTLPTSGDADDGSEGKENVRRDTDTVETKRYSDGENPAAGPNEVVP